jgi:hypothetical protein
LVEAGAQRDNFLKECTEIGIRDCYSRIGVDVEQIPEILSNGRQAAFGAFLEVARALPKVQFLIKPHPAEDQSYYASRIKEVGIRNIRLIPAEMIWDVLNSTDVLLHRQCTTAVEAWIRDLPTIEMTMTRDRALVWPEIEAGSDIAGSSGELLMLIEKHLALRDISASRHVIRQDFIAQHFMAADGRRTAETASAIDQYLRENVSRRASFFRLAKSMNGVRNAAKAGLRYWLDVPPGQSLKKHMRGKALLKRPIEPSQVNSKQITRLEVEQAVRKLAPHVGPGERHGKDH